MGRKTAVSRVALRKPSVKNVMSLSYLAIMLATLLACTRFQDDFNSVSRYCQITPGEAKFQNLFVHLVKQDGTPFTDAERSLAQVRLLSGDTMTSLKLTPGGCVELPSADGLLQIFVPGTGLQLSRAFEKEKVDKGGFQRWFLEPLPSLSAALACPAAGWFVDESLAFPLTLQTTSSLMSSAIRLYLTQEVNGPSLEIFHKPYGQDTHSLPSALSFKGIEEGRYTLQFEILQSFIAWDVPFNVQEALRNCPVTVIHKGPGLDGLPRSDEDKVIAKVGSTLPWTATDSRDQLFVCSELRMKDEDQITEKDACAARSRCLDVKAYTPTSSIIVNEPGVFDYFVYASNPTGKTSEPQCQRVVVVQSDLRLELSWDDPALNRPAASLESPLLDKLGASIKVSHAERRDHDILESLQCRFELLQDGVLPLSASAITCRKGECAGKTLDEYIPCDSQLEASFSPDWLNQGMRPTFVKLHVRVSDGTDRWTHASRGFWVHPDRWRPMLGPETLPRDGQRDLMDYVVTADGQLYGNAHHEFARWSPQDEAWEFPNSDDFLGGTQRIFRSGSGEAFVIATTPIHVPVLEVALYQNYGFGWSQLEHHPEFHHCTHSSIYPHPNGGFFCQVKDRLLIYDLSSWTEMSLPMDRECEEVKLQKNFFIDSDNSSWYACSNRIYRTASNGQWIELEQKFGDVASLLADAEGRLWLLDNGDRDQTKGPMAYRWEEDRWLNVELPSVASDLTASLSPGPQGSVLYYDLLWNEKTQSWQRLQGLERLSKDQNFLAFAVDKERVIFADKDWIGIWTDQGPLRFSPLNWYELSIKSFVPEHIALTDQDQLWFFGEQRESSGAFDPSIGRSYHLRFRNFTIHGQVSQLYLPSALSRTSNFWLNDVQEVILQVDNRGLVYPSAAGFETRWIKGFNGISASAKLGDAFYFVTESRSLLSLIQGELKEVLPPRPEGSSQYRMSPHTSSKTLWVLGGDPEHVWRIQGDSKNKLRLPAALVKPLSLEILELKDQLIIAAHLSGSETLKYFRYVAAIETFEAAAPEALNLPADCIRLKPVNRRYASCLVRARVNTDRFLVNLDNGKAEKLILPRDVDTYSEDFELIQTANDDFVVLGREAVYRGSGKSWIPILDFSWLSSAFPGVNERRFNKVLEDGDQRLWIIGHPFRTLMIDAP